MKIEESDCKYIAIGIVIGAFLGTIVGTCFGMKANAQEFTCTQAMGFSQCPGQWMRPKLSDFLANMENHYGQDVWQFWSDRGAIEDWADPNYHGWDGNPKRSCDARSNNPDRVLLCISGGSRSVNQWANDIQDAVDTMKDKFPSAEEIVLMPVIGAPPGECLEQRAARNHPVIVEAIDLVVNGQDVVAGAQPVVEDCSWYTGDSAGHLTSHGAFQIGEQMFDFYVAFDSGNPPPGDDPIAILENVLVDIENTGLNQADKDNLISKINKAITKINNNDPGACNNLRRFKNKVNEFVGEGKLSQSEANNLNGQITDVEGILGC